MYGLLDQELTRVRIEEDLRQAERVRLVSQSLRERRALRRAQAGSSRVGGLRRTLVYAASALGRLMH